MKTRLPIRRQLFLAAAAMVVITGFAFGLYQFVVSPATAATTWTWDGRIWHVGARQLGSPPMRSTTVAYDPRSHSIVMFGGVDYGSNSDYFDTWTWGDGRWQAQHPSTSPDHAVGSLAPAPSGRVAYVTTGSMYVWDRGNWKVASVPANLFGGFTNSFVYDAQLKEDVYFDGASNTWAWNGVSWTTLTTSCPSCSMQEPHGGMLASTGGQLIYMLPVTIECCPRLVKTVTYEFGTGGWTEASRDDFPDTVSLVVANPLTGKLTAFFENEREMHLVWDGQSWNLVKSNDGYPGGSSRAAAFDPDHRVDVLYGGFD